MAYDDTATVSGSVVSFLNGADDVPLKSCEVALPASLDGYSSVDVVSAGKNLLNYIDYSNSYGITSVTDNGSGSFTVVANVVAAYIDHVIEVKAGETYVIKCVSATNDAGNASQIGTVNVYDGDNSSAPILLEGASINHSQKKFTPTGNKILCRNKVTGGLGGGTGTIVEPQLEIGSTATAYEPYTAPTTHTANLGRTIYGGQADIVNGVGTDGYGNDFTFDGQEINTRLGYNAFWSDQGDTELTYYKSGYGFTSVTVHKETPDGDPVVQTAKLHKIVYGGTADVVKGTCEPKNLLPMANYDGGVYNPDVGRQLNLTVSQTQFEKTGGVYSVSTTVSWKTFTVLFPIISGATYYEKWTLSVESGQQGSTRAYLDEDFKVLAKYNNNSSDPITTNGVMSPPTGAKYLAITWTNRGTAVQTLNITEPQIEKGTSASDFAPHFDPFSFPPISMETDEGENTLFANEGASAITYRKAVD